MRQQKRKKAVLKKYLVALPIPYLDKSGNELNASERQKWTHRAEKELTRCFGATTVIHAPGTNILDGKLLYEKDQTLVLSACDTRQGFIRKRTRIKAFAEVMGRELNQDAVFILGFRSDSCLVEIDAETGD